MKLNLEDRGVVTIFGGHACVGKTSLMLKMFFDSYSTNNEKTVIFTISHNGEIYRCYKRNK